VKRLAVALIFSLCASSPAYAQKPVDKLPVIGWLSPATTQSYSQPGAGSPGLSLLRASLAKQGFVDGQNMRIDMRLAEGKVDQLPGLAEALVRDGASVILAYGEPAGRAAQAATKTLPVVCVADDLVNSGLAASLAKPGSNITGVSILATELDAKKIEVLKDLLPEAKRFGVLNDPATSGPDRPHAMAETARRLGVALQIADVRSASDLAPAIRDLQAGGVEGINVVASAVLNSMRSQLGELSLAAKLPAICQFRQAVEAGCLASYGITIEDLYALAASQVAKLLRGEKPANLPVQQPSRFYLIISTKVAKELGVSLPQSILTRADEVIE
jgi:putative ABC transport system substrate-binding protein